MWGFTNRAARLGEGRRFTRHNATDSGLARIAVRGSVDHATVEVSGELDFSSVDAVAAAVAVLPHQIEAFDLNGLEFADVAGARLLLRLQCDRRTSDGTEPELVGASTSVLRVLELVQQATTRLAVHR